MIFWNVRGNILDITAKNRLTGRDIKVLSGVIYKELTQYFPFKGLSIIDADTRSNIEDTVKKHFPRTTVKRAYSLLIDKLPVWDRVNNAIWFPIDDIIIVLKGVSRPISVEEEVRWLPILFYFICLLASEIKKKAMSSDCCAPPQYLLMWFSSMSKMPPVIYVDGKDRIKKDDLIKKIIDKAIYLGGNDKEGWWALNTDRVNIENAPIMFEHFLKAGAKRVLLIDEEPFLDAESSFKKGLDRLFFMSNTLSLKAISLSQCLLLEKKAFIKDLYSLSMEISSNNFKKNRYIIVGIFSSKDSHSTIFYTFSSMKKAQYELKRIRQQDDRQYIKSIAIIDRAALSPVRLNIETLLFWTAVHGHLLEGDKEFVPSSVTFQLAGDECFSNGDILSSISYYKKSLKLDAQNVDSWNSLAVCYSRLGRIGMAEKAFREAIRLSPEGGMAYYNLGELFLRKKRYEEALSLLKTAYELSEDNNLIITASFLDALLETYNDKKAKDILNAIKSSISKESPSNMRIEKAVLRAEYLLGDIEGAYIRARKFLNNKKGDQEALLILTIGLYKIEGEREKSAEMFVSIDIKQIMSMRLIEEYRRFLNENDFINKLKIKEKI